MITKAKIIDTINYIVESLKISNFGFIHSEDYILYEPHSKTTINKEQ